MNHYEYDKEAQQWIHEGEWEIKKLGKGEIALFIACALALYFGLTFAIDSGVNFL